MFLTPGHLGSDEGAIAESVLCNLATDVAERRSIRLAEDWALQSLGEAYVGIGLGLAKRDLYNVVSTPVSSSKKIA